MRWSLSLGSIGGTEIRIHVTFVLFLVWLAAIYYRAGGPEADLAGHDLYRASVSVRPAGL